MESIHTVGDHDGSGTYAPLARIIGRSPSYLHRSFGFCHGRRFHVLFLMAAFCMRGIGMENELFL